MAAVVSLTLGKNLDKREVFDIVAVESDEAVVTASHGRMSVGALDC